MIATFAIEIALAIYVLIRYKLNVLGRLVVAVLFFLGLFQLAEYNVCGGYGLTAEHWSKIGYAAITTLPPLGLHIMHVIAGKRNNRLIYLAYATMIGFIAYFIVIPTAFRGFECTGNYVIFQLGERASYLYGLFYYGWLLTALTLGVRWLPAMQSKDAVATAKRLSIKGMIVGYLVFLIPTAIANTINPDSRRGIPSIMCGFAVLFALILALYILPKLGTQRRAKP
jgi:hypothetical protein